ncbi:hypothetical protein ACFO0A_05115 [Novosphingobium tardum]|jgi:hypothetical protein|uniref:Uncharacterized protein n=1 Tax=Novosphingobium tardum TaxID=1538021 RepID=A0ABV8RM21_9SPHN
MIDNFALGLTHFLLAVAVWRLLGRADLDREPDAEPAPPKGFSARRPRRTGAGAPHA